MSFQSITTLVSFELSNSVWLVGTRLAGARKSRMHRISAGDTAALLARFEKLSPRQQVSGDTVAIACCFEAGRDGFWIHRLLTDHGIATYVVEPTSILVNRRAKRAKTDRLDAEGLLRVLGAYLAGDNQICSMVHVPTPDEEDGKRIHREREHLLQDRTRLEKRILALLATQGIRSRPSLRNWERDLAALKTGDGRKLPPRLAAEINRLRRRLGLVLDLIRELDAERDQILATASQDPVTPRLQRCGASTASVTALLRFLRVKYSTAPSAIENSSGAMSAWHPCLIRVARWAETGTLVALATREREKRSCSWRGSGCVTSLKANSPLGSASALVSCRAGHAGSRSWRWRASC